MAFLLGFLSGVVFLTAMCLYIVYRVERMDDEPDPGNTTDDGTDRPD